MEKCNYLKENIKNNLLIIRKNLESIKTKINSVCEKHNIDAKKITIIAVTKKRSLDEVKEVINHGIKNIAESRTSEAIDKILNLDVKKYFVGHLQTNKVKKAVQLFDVIASVDSLKLAKKIDEVSKDLGKIQEIYFQINIGKEDSKYGVDEEEALKFYDKLVKLLNIKVIGIMCIAPLDKDPRIYFKKMKKIFDILPVSVLSMGMSDDFEIAIEEGSTEIRLGRCIFNKR